MIDAMLAAGLTREQMAALLKHELAKAEQRKAEKRAKDAVRKRRQRHAESRDVTRTERDGDGQGVTPPPLNDPLSNLDRTEVSLNPTPYNPPPSKNSDDRFPSFWQAFPRRQGGNSRKNAETRFRSAVKAGVSPETIIDGARRYAEHCDATGKTGTEFVKTAEAWLNGRFWESDWSISLSRPAPPFRQARRNTALEGLDELERRFTNGQHQPTLRIAG